MYYRSIKKVPVTLKVAGTQLSENNSLAAISSAAFS